MVPRDSVTDANGAAIATAQVELTQEVTAAT